MSENKVEVTKEVRGKGPSLKKRVGLTAAAGMAAISLVGVVDREARAASTVDNTPTTATATRTVTPSPTATSTPTDTEKQIAAMQTVVAKAVDEAQKQRILKDLQATATALAETPTATPKPADVEATRTARQDEAYGKERARLEAEYNRTHPTATPLGPTPTPAPVMKAGTGGDEGGFPLGTRVVIGGAFAVALVSLGRFGGRIWGGARALAGRGIIGVRNRLPHGGGSADPGAGVPEAGGPPAVP